MTKEATPGPQNDKNGVTRRKFLGLDKQDQGRLIIGGVLAAGVVSVAELLTREKLDPVEQETFKKFYESIRVPLEEVAKIKGSNKAVDVAWSLYKKTKYDSAKVNNRMIREEFDFLNQK